jgi:hypothetical protein
MGKGVTQLIYCNEYKPIAMRGVIADMKCKIINSGWPLFASILQISQETSDRLKKETRKPGTRMGCPSFGFTFRFLVFWFLA